MSDGTAFVAAVAVIWIGWPLHQIAGHLAFIVKRPRSAVCADGFVQKPYCTGKYGCPMCGRTDARVLPACLKDEVPEHHANADGSPRYFHREG